MLHLGILQLRVNNDYVVCIVSNLLDIIYMVRNTNIFYWVQGLKNILNIIYIYKCTTFM